MAMWGTCSWAISLRQVGTSPPPKYNSSLCRLIRPPRTYPSSAPGVSSGSGFLACCWGLSALASSRVSAYPLNCLLDSTWWLTARPLGGFVGGRPCLDGDVLHHPGHHVNGKGSDVVAGPVHIDVVGDSYRRGSHRAYSY